MPQSTESDCPPGHLNFGMASGEPRVAAGSETVGQAAHWSPEPASLGYRRRPHPGGTLGNEVGTPPARGEDGPSMAVPH
ncbi:MAG: hypothetical protein QOH07_2459, partial [Mycobacterium sp.]|nr:hypothetical protein [Mycobacterium sp.]